VGFAGFLGGVALLVALGLAGAVEFLEGMLAATAGVLAADGVDGEAGVDAGLGVEDA
jgi:hypothetical protein